MPRTKEVRKGYPKNYVPFGFGLWVFLCVLFPIALANEGRHSFSLTTFDPKGTLGQVEKAQLAASLGTPILGVAKADQILLVAPQILPSPFVEDDGTPRFASIAPHIVLGHSGISSDGRLLLEKAQRIAIEHAYTYDEPIPVGLFLEELSLLLQAYTMKPGARPFGCTLLVGVLQEQGPRLFQMDPSGSVVEVDGVAIIHGRFPQATREALRNFAREPSNENDKATLARILQEGLGSPTNSGEETPIRLPLRILCASFHRTDGFCVERSMASTT